MLDIEQSLMPKVNNFEKHAGVQSTLIVNTCRKEKYAISILIPTYKRVQTLKDTIASCINQIGFEDYNIIVCDNNPEREDETEQYITSLPISNLKYYKNERSIGMYGNINRLYELSNGNLSVCVHDDDMLFPHFLQILNDVMSRYGEVDILFPLKVKWYEDKGELKPKENILPKRIIRKITNYDLLRGNSYPPTGFIAKTNRIFEIGGFDENKYPSSDYYFNVKAIRYLKVYELSQPLYIYRWACNISFKLDTLIGFLDKDIALMNVIARSNYVLRLFKEYLISEHCKGYIEKIASLYPEYNVNSLPYYEERISIYSKTKNMVLDYLWRIVYKIIRMRNTIYL